MALAVARERTDLIVSGIDVDPLALALADNRTQEHDLGRRVRTSLHDALREPLPQAETICCNPPLVPGERDFVTDDSPELFIHALLRQLQRSHARHVLIHVFDFHGIYSSTGRWPSVAEVAESRGFGTLTVFRGTRSISTRSRLRRHLAPLATHFPRGIVLLDGEETQLEDVRCTSTFPMDTWQSIIRLERIR